MDALKLRGAVFRGHVRLLGQAWVEVTVPGGGQFPLTVAVDPDRPFPQPGQPLQGLRRHGAGGHVAVEHDRIRTGRVHPRQHGIEGGQVPVNVGKNGDAHDGLSRVPAPRR